jgi:hypothetical protein
MILVKYGKLNHLEMLQNGIIRFAPLSYYRKYEKEQDVENGISDNLEGMAIDKVDNVRFDFPNGLVREYLGNITINMDLEGSELTPIFCISTYKNISEFKDSMIEMKRRFKEHTHYLLIEDWEQFRDDVHKISDGITSGLVTYQDEIPIVINETETWRYSFYKRNRYSYQNEYRFVMTNESIMEPIFRNFNSKVTMIIAPL